MNSCEARRSGYARVKPFFAAAAPGEVVGVERGVLGHPRHAFAAEQARIDVGTQQHARVAGERRQTADRQRPILLAYEAIPRRLPGCGFALLDHRDRQEWPQALAHANRARTRTATAVRRAEGLVQVHVDRIEAHVAGPHLAEDRVEVRAVVVQQPARLMHEPGDLDDAPLEHADRRWVGQHDAGRVRAQHLLQRLDVDVAVGQRRDLAHAAAADRRRRRIRSMRGVGHDDLRASRIAAMLVVGHDHRDAGELTLRASHRRERHAPLHAGHVGEDLLQLVHARQEALAQRFGRVRMAAGESIEHRQRMAGARVVFHRARTERIEVRVDREVLARQVRVMAYGLQLRHLRQSHRRRAQEALGQVRAGDIGWKLRGGGAPRLGLLEDQHGWDRNRTEGA